MKIPFLSFDYQDDLYRNELIDAMTQVLDSKWYVMGKNLELFEKNYADLHKTKYSLGVANGLDAITISLKTLGIKEGDEIIVPSNTYIATWLAPSALGATIVPVEPNPKTYNIDPDKIEEAITEKTKAIIPVHLYGQSCDMEKIMKIAEKYNLYVIEDNAQAHLSTWNGKITGSFGHINATSFYPGKNLGALGDGGGITTDIEVLAIKVRTYRNYGSQKKYYNDVLGTNSRLDELQAAVLNVKLPYLKELTEERVKIAKKFDALLKNVEYITTPYTHPNATHAYHLYVIKCKNRDELQKFLNDNGIGTLIHYPVPPHLQEAYKFLNYKKGDFPLAEEIASNCLSLPMFPGLTDENIEFICNKIKEFYAI